MKNSFFPTSSQSDEKSGIRSNMQMVQEAMVIEPPKNKKNWSRQRRVPSLLKPRIAVEREQYAARLKKLQIVNEKENRGVKNFLVVKRRLGYFLPIGFSKSFKQLEEVKEFAKEQGRAIVRVFSGAVRKDYQIAG